MFKCAYYEPHPSLLLDIWEGRGGEVGVTGGTPERSSPNYTGPRVEDYILGKQELPLFPLSRHVHVQINRRGKTYSLHLFWPRGCRHFNHCVLNADSLFGMPIHAKQSI